MGIHHTSIRIVSMKHNHSFHRSWENNLLLYEDSQVLIGGNNRTIVKESDDKEWRTDSSALFYFPRYYWFNIVTIFENNNTYYFYCNLSSPFSYENNTLFYTDYDIDVIVQQDGSFEIVDLDEYKVNSKTMHYPQEIKDKLMQQLKVLQRWIQQGQNPFNEEFVKSWYDRYTDKLK